MKARTKLIAFCAAAIVVLAAGFAWACTEAAGVSMGSNSGPAGTPVTITGKSFAPGPVEIRWNRSDGRLVGMAEGPDFSIQITPPAGTLSDVYYVVAIQNGPTGKFKASETFEVTGLTENSAGSVSTELWSGFANTATDGDVAPASQSPSSSALAGVGLLAAGAIALVGTLSVALVARRKAESR